MIPALANRADRCAHGYAPVQHPHLCLCPGSDPDRLKAQALARVESAAAPEFRDRIDAAIRSAAALGEPFSANDLRASLSDVPGPLVGARFNAAAKSGLIVHVGYTPSTKGNTHAHDIKLWKGRTA